MKKMLKMKIKTYLKNKKVLTIVAAIIVVLGLLGGGGLYLAQSKNKESNKTDEKATQEKSISKEEQTQENLKGKEGVQSQTSSNTNSNVQSNPSVVTSTLLSDVSIQAIKSSDGSIFLSLYGAQGTYDAEKCLTYQAGQCPGGWTATVSNQSYSGHGGLSLETISLAEGSPSYIIYRVENNKRVSSSKPIVVNTASILDTKSFIGE